MGPSDLFTHRLHGNFPSPWANCAVSSGIYDDVGRYSPSIVLFHKSQCALRYLDLMSKIQNTSSHRSLGTCLTVTANEQNGDWPAPVSRVSVQPVIGWLKYEVARQWSHIVHRPRPHNWELYSTFSYTVFVHAKPSVSTVHPSLQ